MHYKLNPWKRLEQHEAGHWTLSGPFWRYVHCNACGFGINRVWTMWHISCMLWHAWCSRRPLMIPYMVYCIRYTTIIYKSTNMIQQYYMQLISITFVRHGQLWKLAPSWGRHHGVWNAFKGTLVRGQVCARHRPPISLQNLDLRNPFVRINFVVFISLARPGHERTEQLKAVIRAKLEDWWHWIVNHTLSFNFCTDTWYSKVMCVACSFATLN